MTVTVKAPAKINLFLRVLRRRADGYHDVESLLCTVGIYDSLTITIGSRRQGVSCEHPEVPENGANLVLRAVDLFFKSAARIGLPTDNVHIAIDKKIPVGAGLGGGSSNAAAVLNVLNQFFRRPFTSDRLRRIASRIGADVPFFIDGLPAVATGIGDILNPIEGLRPWPVVIIYPGFSIRTDTVYSKLNLRLTKCEKKLKCLDFRKLKSGLPPFWINDLEPVVIAQYPQIQSIKNLLADCGARGTLMSGSGSSVFGIFNDPEQASAAHTAASQHKEWEVYISRILT
jgi:4-diphosphocytidyl-2-C-methyl-D-erythritol kinase